VSRRTAVRAWIVALTVATAGCAALEGVTGVAQTRELQRTGVAAQASIVRIRDSGMTLNDDPVVWLDLVVHPEGRPPYPAATKSPISRLDVPRFQPGAQVPVRYDPADPARVALDVYRFR
jgi:hypothetical protein